MTLIGTEKQIRWAEGIKKELLKQINEAKLSKKILEVLEIETRGLMSIEQLIKILEIKINEVEESEFFINHRKETLSKWIDLLEANVLVKEDEEKILRTENTNKGLVNILVLTNTLKIEIGGERREIETNDVEKVALEVGIEYLKGGYSITCNKRNVIEEIKVLYSIKEEITETERAEAELRQEIAFIKKEVECYFYHLQEDKTNIGKKLALAYLKSNNGNINKPLKNSDETEKEKNKRAIIEEVFINLFRDFNLRRKKFEMWLWANEVEEALDDKEFKEIRIMRNCDGYLALKNNEIENKKYYINKGTFNSDSELYFGDIYRFYYINEK